MSYLPSYNNSTNERNERRANWKQDVRKPKVSEHTTEALRVKFEKAADKLLADGKVSHCKDNEYRVKSGAFRFYSIYRLQGKFCCDCRDNESFGCTHEIAAEKFAAILESETAQDCDIAETVTDHEFVTVTAKNYTDAVLRARKRNYSATVRRVGIGFFDVHSNSGKTYTVRKLGNIGNIEQSEGGKAWFAYSYPTDGDGEPDYAAEATETVWRTRREATAWLKSQHKLNLKEAA